ncbi:ABC transporter type 1, transmembrane domain-containing protein [Chytridium lagenaria]|nr:ABC transporter type 1, transmembrane domain-containing protein [Chytridium lagenaria]
MERIAIISEMLLGVGASLSSLAGPAMLYQRHWPAGCTTRRSFFYVTILGLVTLLRPLFDAHAWNTGIRAGFRAKTAIINEIYVKSMRRRAPTTTKKEASEESGDGDDDDESGSSTGRIINLLTSDAERIRMAFMNFSDLVVCPVQIIFSVAALFYVIGWPAVVGLAILISIMPISYFVAQMLASAYDKLMQATDKRTTAVNEMLQGIRVIKYFAWEARFYDKLRDLRSAELSKLARYYASFATDIFINLAAPVFVAFFTLFTITQVAGQPLDAKKAFTCITLFNTLRWPLQVLPGSIQSVLQLKVALKRIDKFLGEPELERFQTGNDDETISIDNAADSVGFTNGCFSWEESITKNDNTDTANACSQDISSNETTPLLNSSTFKSSKDSNNSPSPKLASSIAASTSQIDAFHLRNLTLGFPNGGLTAICGPTGSGKSSILQALLGEMHRISGTAFLPLKNKNVAYVAQTSWLRNATIRENILFGEPYYPERYSKVVRACALEADFKNLESGDLTEIGEKGINLSGGQKQRISLARAVYSPAIYILLDDPLSAVDAPTAKFLLHNAILRHLRGENRTVLLVTHATNLVLPHADHIVVVRNGEIAASGSVADILKTANDDILTSLGGKPVGDEKESFEEMADVDPFNLPDFANGRTVEDASKLVEDETMDEGSVKVSLYMKLFKSGGGLTFAVALMAAVMMERLTDIGANMWVREWTRERGEGNNTDIAQVALTSDKVASFAAGVGIKMAQKFWESSNELYSIMGDDDVTRNSLYYSGIYGLISFACVLCFVLTIFVVCVGSYRASRVYHDSLMSRLLYAPMRFFETTPIGRILNRASKDIGQIDLEVMFSVDNVAKTVFEAVAIFFVISSIAPFFIAAIIPLGCIHMMISRRYLKASRSLKRLESVTRSPIYSMFSETLNNSGVSTIRAYCAEKEFIDEILNRIEKNNRAFLYLWVANRWLQVRVSTISTAVVFFAGTCVVLGRDYIDPGLAGVCLVFSLSCNDTFIWLIRHSATLEMDMNSVERIEEYLNIEQEKPAIIDSRRPPPSWPFEGSIKVEGLEMRYTPDGSSVLKDVSFHLRGGEKLGVVGRTGAGKSSLTLSLFRIVEPFAGIITIDGVDICDIGLHDLRSRLTIIPQDPVLFAGTLRTNLDPFDEHSDAVLRACLDQVKFWDTVQVAATQESLVVEDVSDALTLAGAGDSISLDSTVAEGGTTASVDNETDNQIQQTIRSKEFFQTTVISIAHRLRTVADYDKILVLDKGRVVQFGSPLELMQVEGQFLNMCIESGDLEVLQALAKKERAF